MKYLSAILMVIFVASCTQLPMTDATIAITTATTPTIAPTVVPTPTFIEPTNKPLPTPTGPVEIPANPEKGFEWPYLLYIPSKVSGSHILVIPNNTGSRDNNLDVHRESALNTMESRVSWARTLEVPLLVPIFPRFDDESDGTIASQYLGRGTMEESWMAKYPLVAREDLQMVAMIDDAIQNLTNLGFDIDKKVLIEGYSASAMFTSRFTVLHPDRVQASVFGGHGWAIVPTDRWNQFRLPYPYGTGDIETLTGTPFNIDEFRKIAFFIYMGEKDDNGWALPWYVGEYYDRSEYYAGFKDFFGTSAQEMSDSAKEIYDSLGCSATFLVYKNQDHSSAFHERDILKFLQDHK